MHQLTCIHLGTYLMQSFCSICQSFPVKCCINWHVFIWGHIWCKVFVQYVNHFRESVASIDMYSSGDIFDAKFLFNMSIISGKVLHQLTCIHLGTYLMQSFCSICQSFPVKCCINWHVFIWGHIWCKVFVQYANQFRESVSSVDMYSSGDIFDAKFLFNMPINSGKAAKDMFSCCRIIKTKHAFDKWVTIASGNITDNRMAYVIIEYFLSVKHLPGYLPIHHKNAGHMHSLGVC